MVTMSSSDQQHKYECSQLILSGASDLQRQWCKSELEQRIWRESGVTMFTHSIFGETRELSIGTVYTATLYPHAVAERMARKLREAPSVEHDDVIEWEQGETYRDLLGPRG